jgi:hypothetical protein
VTDQRGGGGHQAGDQEGRDSHQQLQAEGGIEDHPALGMVLAPDRNAHVLRDGAREPEVEQAVIADECGRQRPEPVDPVPQVMHDERHQEERSDGPRDEIAHPQQGT